MADLTNAQIQELRDLIDNNDTAEEFYIKLMEYDPNYGRLGLEVTTNHGWQGEVANDFAAAGAESVGKDLTFGSTLWKSVNKDRARSYIDQVEANGGFLLNREEIQQIHEDAYLAEGLDPNFWLPYLLLENAFFPDAMWDDWMQNEGWIDIFKDAAEMFFLTTAPEDFIPIVKDVDFIFGDGIDTDKQQYSSNFWEAIKGFDLNDFYDLYNDLPSIPDEINSYINQAASSFVSGIQSIVQGMSDWAVGQLLGSRLNHSQNLTRIARATVDRKFLASLS